jgi:triphosphoribosyl-dephospho-CoA synthetase
MFRKTIINPDPVWELKTTGKLDIKEKDTNDQLIKELQEWVDSYDYSKMSYPYLVHVKHLLTAIEERDREIATIKESLLATHKLEADDLWKKIEQAEAGVEELSGDLGTVDMAGVQNDMDKRQTIKELRERVAELEATQEYATDACMTCKQKHETHLTTAREALDLTIPCLKDWIRATGFGEVNKRDKAALSKCEEALSEITNRKEKESGK